MKTMEIRRNNSAGFYSPMYWIRPAEGEQLGPGVCNPTLLVGSLYSLEFAAHGRVMHPQVRSDLLQPGSMLPVGVGNPGFSILRKNPLKWRLDCL
jgi:hypothetical protein